MKSVAMFSTLQSGIHRNLGPGLLESVYEAVLAGKLEQLGYRVDRQRPIDIEYEGLRFAAAFRIDLLLKVGS